MGSFSRCKPDLMTMHQNQIIHQMNTKITQNVALKKLNAALYLLIWKISNSLLTNLVVTLK